MTDGFDRPAGWHHGLVAPGLAVGTFAANIAPPASLEDCCARRDGRCPGPGLCAHCPWAAPVRGATESAADRSAP